MALSNTELRTRIIQAAKENLPFSLTRSELIDLAAWASGQNASTDFATAQTARSVKATIHDTFNLSDPAKLVAHTDLYARLATLAASKEGALTTRLSRFEVNSLGAVV